MTTEFALLGMIESAQQLLAAMHGATDQFEAETDGLVDQISFAKDALAGLPTGTHMREDKDIQDLRDAAERGFTGNYWRTWSSQEIHKHEAIELKRYDEPARTVQTKDLIIDPAWNVFGVYWRPAPTPDQSLTLGPIDVISYAGATPEAMALIEKG